jgi:hypothetical protein
MLTIQNDMYSGQVHCEENEHMKYECDGNNCKLGHARPAFSKPCYNRFLDGKGCYEILKYEQGSLSIGVRLGQINIDRAHAYVGEYTGDIKTVEWAGRQESNKVSYVAQFAKKAKNGCIVDGSSKGFVIDATNTSNILKFINHSCSPNLYFELWNSSGGVPRLCMFSLEPIKMGTWLSISYGSGSNLLKFFKDGKCLCGSSNCISIK